MVTEFTSQDFTAQPSDTGAEEAALQTARAKAIAEIDALQARASAEEQTRAATTNYSVHETPGFGRYVIPTRTGWKPLLDIIHDPVPNIDFSANIYPNFDGVIGDHFQSPYLLDPLDDKYESYESLRDNLAAVRNFLLQTYYSNTPDAMSTEKARQSLTEIAGFVGDGLYNNWLFLGLVPNHNPTKPFIDLSEARKPGGRGAQYIYEKILEHQRHNNWMRPFAAVAALFGGKSIPDWKLPPASTTHFDDYLGEAIAADEAAQSNTTLSDANSRLAAIEARLSKLYDARALSITAHDLDALGNQLIFTAQNLQGVAHIDEPVRLKAVAIAKDILNKLKIKLGDKNVLDGLNMKPSEDMAVLGGIKGVAMTYERLLAWARGNNDTAIFQHPSVIAATQGIGQLGYLAKREAQRMALVAGNTVIAGNITEQMKRLPAVYTNIGSKTFASVLDTVEHGLDAVLNRVQEVGVSGAKIGKSVDNRGTSMDAPPTAGSATISSTQDAAQRNAQLLAAQQLATMAQAQRNEKSDSTRQTNNAQATGNPNQGRAGNNRGNTAQRQQQRTNTNTTQTTATAQQDAARKAANFAAQQTNHQEDHHQEDLHRQQLWMQQQQQQQQQQKAREAQAKAAAKATTPAGAKIDPSMIKGLNLKGFDMKGITGDGKALQPGRSIKPETVVKPPVQSLGAIPVDPNQIHQPPQQPQQPGRGR